MMLVFPCLPHVVIFFEECVVFNRPLLELHIYAAAVDADDASDPTVRGERIHEEEGKRLGGKRRNGTSFLQPVLCKQ